METLKVLITVKTYPIPSSKYDELVCTAGVLEDGSFIRLYPINFRELNENQRFRKYQWISVKVAKHKGRDARKESYRPDCDSIRLLGEPIPTRGNWRERARFALAKKARSMEDLYDQQEADRTSLGIFRPKSVIDLIFDPDDPDWKPTFKAELAQSRFWDDRKVTIDPPQKVPWKFTFKFECDDPRCKGNHRLSILDWEVGALYWKLIRAGAPPEEAATGVRTKFLEEICASTKDTHFFVGTILAHPKTWVIIGTFWPPTESLARKSREQPQLFE